MENIAKEHRNFYKQIDKDIRASEKFFRENKARFHKSKRFLYVSTLSKTDIGVLDELGKPALEFNILESYISRQKGEFAKQEPSVEVGAQPGKQVDPETINVVEGHMRYMESESRNDNTAPSIHDDMLSGGFSVAEVYTDYVDEMSFEQKLGYRRVYDPTLCGFDPMARLRHKADGAYCYEITPMRVERIKEIFGNKADLSKVTYLREDEIFNWSYKDPTGEKFIMLVTYYRKRIKKTDIVKLSDDNTMTKKDYEKFVVDWEFSQQMGQVPQVVDTRRANYTEIVRYRCIENQVIDYKVTDYEFLPLVFFDNNSTTLRKDGAGLNDADGGAKDTNYIDSIEQVTRPYCYQATGVQKMKDLAGQTIANEIENLVQHKFKLPIEGIPDQYKDAYTDVQTPNTLMYHQFLDQDPEKRLDPPQEIARIPLPPEVVAIFNGTDQTTQAILGTYDAALGISKNQLSGVAILEGATQNNATSMPTIVNYLCSYGQVLKIMANLIPKYLKTPRTIPVLGKDGSREFRMVNEPGSPSLKYHPNALNVKVSPGVNFSIQKSRAVQTMTSIMQVSPTFAEFMNSKGLPVLLDNLEIRGIDQLKDLVEEFLQEMEAMKKQQQQNAAQNNPEMMKYSLEQQKIQKDAVNDERKAKLEAGKLVIDNERQQTQRMQVVGNLENDNRSLAIREKEADAENTRSAVDIAVKAADMSHQHHKDVIELSRNGKSNEE